jgi:hypothetical protein
MKTLVLRVRVVELDREEDEFPNVEIFIIEISNPSPHKQILVFQHLPTKPKLRIQIRLGSIYSRILFAFFAEYQGPAV